MGSWPVKLVGDLDISIVSVYRSPSCLKMSFSKTSARDAVARFVDDYLLGGPIGLEDIAHVVNPVGTWDEHA